MINDVEYEVECCVRAVDLALKSFFALNCAYPEAAFNEWLFIQHAGFCIEVPGDTLSLSLKVLLGYVEKAATVSE